MNYCNCGNIAGPFIRGKHLCWECWDGLERWRKANGTVPVVGGKHVCDDRCDKADATVQIKPTGSIHIDFDSTISGGRVRLCTSQAWGVDGADPVNHPTPEIAAALLAQHPNKDKEFCERCLHLLRMYWPEEIAKAKAYAATLK